MAAHFNERALSRCPFPLLPQVHTSTDRQDFNYGQFAVIRRFKDFVWLSHRLEEEFPGIVMPALPVKMLVGKFDQTFVEVQADTLLLLKKIWLILSLCCWWCQRFTL